MNNKQPKALIRLVMVHIWERFSYYGMLALLLLYLVSQLGFADARAYGVCALYGSLAEFGGVFGGILADSLLGLQATIAVGGCILMAGHLCLALGGSPELLFTGLSLIIVGTGLISSNTAAFLGLFYEPGDTRREAGFTFYYVGINVGAFMATILCAWVAENYGWHYGFGLAAIGMFIGLLTLFFSTPTFKGKGLPPRRVKKREMVAVALGLGLAVVATAVMLIWEEIFMPLMVPICIALIGYTLLQLKWAKAFSTEKLFFLLLFFIAFVIFYAAEMLVFSALLLFNERHGSGFVLGAEVPSPWLMSVNPLVIIVGGYLVARFVKSKQKEDSLIPVITALLFSAGAYGGLTYFLGTQPEIIPTLAVMGVVFVISFSELFVGPDFYAFCSHAASKAHQGLMMGLVPLGFALATALSGMISKTMALENPTEAASMELFTAGFYQVSLYLMIAAVVIGTGYYLLIRKRKVVVSC